MFIEVDDGLLVNMDNILCIRFKAYNNRGAWEFEGMDRVITSRQFNSQEEARSWLRNIFNTFQGLSVYLEGSALKEEARRKRLV